HVEVHADEDVLALEVGQVGEGLFGHAGNPLVTREPWTVSREMQDAETRPSCVFDGSRPTVHGPRFLVHTGLASACRSRATCSAIARGAFGVPWPRRPCTFSQTPTGPGPVSASAAPPRQPSNVSNW